MEVIAVVVVCVVVLGIYAKSANSGILELLSSPRDGSYYNQLVQGFQAGQLSLKKEVPPGFAALPDPYDPAAVAPYIHIPGNPIHDLSYYKGRFYLYFGVTPALLLFWPYRILTGGFLLHREAVLIFCCVSFLAGAGLIRAMWRRYYAEVKPAVMLAGVLVFGLASLVPSILQRSDVWEVAIACAYAMTMLSLVGVWNALHQPNRRALWLAAASMAYGLALGARPSLLFGAVILLVPLVRLRIADCGLRIAAAGAGAAAPGLEIRNPQSAIRNHLLAVGLPLLLIGSGLLWYNAARFGDPLEFGQHYQFPRPLALTEGLSQFSTRYLGFNLRVGFFAPAKISSRFPFVDDIDVPTPPRGGDFECPFGLLTNVPFVWLALLAPLAMRGGLAGSRSGLSSFVGSVALLFGTSALMLVLHNSMCLRYELEYAWPLVLLAVVGVFELERRLINRGWWRHVARVGWIGLLIVSVAFNLLAGVCRNREFQSNYAYSRMQLGHFDEAILFFRRILEDTPDDLKANTALGTLLIRTGRMDEAIEHYRKFLKPQPGYAQAYADLGVGLQGKGLVAEAMASLETALQIEPGLAGAHYNLGSLLEQREQIDAAILRYERALRVSPNFGSAHHNLARLLLQKGSNAAAIGHFQKVVDLEPGNMAGYGNLGYALVIDGKDSEAAAVYERALRLQPSNVQMAMRLAVLLVASPDRSVRNGARAVELAEEANRRSEGKDLEVLGTLGMAYAETGRFPEAIAALEQALRLPAAQGSPVVMEGLEKQLELYRTNVLRHNVP